MLTCSISQDVRVFGDLIQEGCRVLPFGMLSHVPFGAKDWRRRLKGTMVPAIRAGYATITPRP